jgi:hypothetical protein
MAESRPANLSPRTSLEKLVPLSSSEGTTSADIRRETGILWREHRKLEMAATAITTPVSALFVGYLFHLLSGAAMEWGAFVAGLIAALITVPLTLVVMYYYFRIVEAPRSLYARTKGELLSAQAQLNELSKTWLRLEVDTSERHQRRLQAYQNFVTIVPGPSFFDDEGSFEDKGSEHEFVDDQYLLKATFRVVFDNPATSENRMRYVTVSLLRDADGKESAVPVSKQKITTRMEAGPKIELSDILVSPSQRTDPFWLECVFWLEPAVATELDENCFLRLTMAALRQPDQSVDLEADWIKATDNEYPISLSRRQR